jgi:hypothetical protein
MPDDFALDRMFAVAIGERGTLSGQTPARVGDTAVTWGERVLVNGIHIDDVINEYLMWSRAFWRNERAARGAR